LCWNPLIGPGGTRQASLGRTEARVCSCVLL
jgi:hypothetical protein